jgi:hypothetical protein
VRIATGPHNALIGCAALQPNGSVGSVRVALYGCAGVPVSNAIVVPSGDSAGLNGAVPMLRLGTWIGFANSLARSGLVANQILPLPSKNTPRPSGSSYGSPYTVVVQPTATGVENLSTGDARVARKTPKGAARPELIRISRRSADNHGP